MLNKKCLITILGFCLLCVMVLYLAISSNIEMSDQSMKEAERKDEISSFKDVYFYKAFHFKPSLILESSDLEIRNNDKLSFTAPNGLFYSKGVEYKYVANSGILLQGEKDLYLKGDVKLSGADSNYSSDEVFYSDKKGILKANGNVKAKVIDTKTYDLLNFSSDNLVSYVEKEVTELSGNVDGVLKRQKVYEGKLKFSAEKVVFKALESLLELNQNVKLHRNNYYLQSGTAQIFMENFNKKLKYYALYDDVKLEESFTSRFGEKKMRRAFSEKLEGVQSTGRIILTGAPRVEQGNDVIKGYQITLRENTQLIEVDDAQSRFSVQKD